MPISFPCRLLSGGSLDTPTLQDAPARFLGHSAPDTLIYPAFQGVLQAWLAHRAAFADATSRFDADAVVREEDIGRYLATQSLLHPFRFHGDLPRLMDFLT